MSALPNIEPDPSAVAWEWASPKQYQAWATPPEKVLYLAGGMGSGKSLVQCRKLIDYALRYPGSRLLVIRCVGKHLRDTTMVTFYAALPPAYLDSRSDISGTCRLKNGSEFLFIHLDKPGSEGALLSLEVNGVFINEASELNEKLIDATFRRVGRWTNAEVPEAWVTDVNGKRVVDPTWQWKQPNGNPLPPPLRLLDSNPVDDQKHWLFRRFYAESREHTEKRIPELDRETRKLTGRLLSYADLGYTMLVMPSSENRFLPAENLQQIYASGDAERWAEGKVMPRKGKIHTIHPDSLIMGTPDILRMIRMRCRLSRVLDHGTTAPTACGWFGQDGEGSVFMYREYNVPDKLISYHREAIFVLSEGEQYSENLADPSIFAKSMKRNDQNRCTWSVADEYLDRGMYKPQTAIAWRPAENQELGTRNRISEYLAWDKDHINPFTNQRGAPHFYFILQSPEYPQGVVHGHTETENQRLVELADGSFSLERDADVVDHVYDCYSPQTMIDIMDDGWKRVEIRNAPKSGIVLTVSGPCKYDNLGRYKAWSEMVTVELESGSSVTCTPEHLFLTDAGWIKARDLAGRKCLIQSYYLTGDNPSSASRTAPIRHLGTCVAILDACMSRFTGLTTDLYQLVAWSITSTIAGLTTQLQTSQYKLAPSTQASITRIESNQHSKSLAGFSGQSDSFRQSVAGSGSGSIPLSTSKESLTPERVSLNARGVGRISYQLLRLFGALSAAFHASRNGLVSTCVRSVRRAPPSEAWCLEVGHKLHSFTANGIVGSNCIRYFIAARRPLTKVVPTFPKGSIGYDIAVNQRELERAKAQHSEYGL